MSCNKAALDMRKAKGRLFPAPPGFRSTFRSTVQWVVIRYNIWDISDNHFQDNTHSSEGQAKLIDRKERREEQDKKQSAHSIPSLSFSVSKRNVVVWSIYDLNADVKGDVVKKCSARACLGINDLFLINSE